MEFENIEKKFIKIMSIIVFIGFILVTFSFIMDQINTLSGISALLMFFVFMVILFLIPIIIIKK